MGGDPPALAGEPGGLVQGDDVVVAEEDEAASELDLFRG
jgi:hypothetical protein